MSSIALPPVVHTIASIAEEAGGPSRSVTALVDAVACTGHAVHLVAGRHRPREHRWIEPSHASMSWVDCLTFRGRRAGYLGFFHAVRKSIIKAEEGSIVHDHGIWLDTNVSAWLAAKSTGAVYVLSPRGMLEPWALKFRSAKKNWAWHIYQRRIVEGADAIVATSEQEAIHIKQLSPSSTVAIVPNGVNLPSPGRSIKSEGPRVALFMSRIHPKKNILGLIDAWAHLHGNGQTCGWILRLAGPDEGGHLAEVQQRIVRLGMERQISYVGPIAESDKAQVYNNAHLFVLPSHSENFGIVVAEALAHAVPVITTHGTPWAELPSHHCGWHVPCTSAALIAAMAQALIMPPEQLAEMGSRGRDLVASRYSWQQAGMRMSALYSWLVNQQDAAARPDFVMP